MSETRQEGLSTSQNHNLLPSDDSQFAHLLLRGPKVSSQQRSGTRSRDSFKYHAKAKPGTRPLLLVAKGIATRSRSKDATWAPGPTTSSKKLVGTSASLLVTSALLVVTRS